MNISTFLMGIVYMAIVAVLVKPDSRIATVITDLSDALSNLTYAAIKGEAQ